MSPTSYQAAPPRVVTRIISTCRAQCQGVGRPFQATLGCAGNRIGCAAAGLQNCWRWLECSRARRVLRATRRGRCAGPVRSQGLRLRARTARVMCSGWKGGRDGQRPDCARCDEARLFESGSPRPGTARRCGVQPGPARALDRKKLWRAGRSSSASPSFR